MSASPNYGQDIALNELRIQVRAANQRVAWALAIGVGTFILLVLYGSPDLIANAVRYAWAMAIHSTHGMFPSGSGSVQEKAFKAAKYWTLMYRQRGEWALYGALGCGACVASYVGLTQYFNRLGKRDVIDRVARGSSLVSPRSHNQFMRSQYGKKPPLEMGFPLQLGVEKVLVPQALQYLHFAFAGVSGSGKSTAIGEIIEQAIARGDKGLVVDLGGVFHAQFGRPHDHILSLRDRRSKRWDFWHEPGISEEAMSAAMVEEETQGNTYFWKGARAVLASLLRHNSNVEGLWEDFKKPTKEIREKLAQADEISRRIMGDNDSDQADGIIGTTVLDFPFLGELNQWAQKGQEFFSISQWLNDPDDSSWTYVLVTENDLPVAKPLLRLWFDIACLAALGRTPHDSCNRHTWLILDEIKTLGRLSSLPPILDKGRKFKTSVVLGFQSMSQFERLYGESDAKSILQATQNQFFFRMSEVEATRYVSAIVGEHDVEQTSLGVSYGDGKTADRGSINRNLVRKPIVMPDEVRTLQPLQAYARLGGHAAFKMRFRVTSRPLLWPLAASERNPRLPALATPSEDSKPLKSIPTPTPLSPSNESFTLPFIGGEVNL